MLRVVRVSFAAKPCARALSREMPSAVRVSFTAGSVAGCAHAPPSPLCAATPSLGTVEGELGCGAVESELGSGAAWPPFLFDKVLILSPVEGERGTERGETT